MKRVKNQKRYRVSAILNELPVAGAMFNEEKVIRVKRISSESEFMATRYKILTGGKHGRKRHYFICVPQRENNKNYGTLGSGN